MYILTVAGKENVGAYSVPDGYGNRFLYLFEEEDDAERYAMMLEDDQDYPEMHILEVESDIMIKTCQLHGYNYTVITANDIVIPPSIKHDFI